MRHFVLALLLIAALLASPCVRAQSITLKSSVRFGETNGTIHVDGLLENQGTVIAEQVVVVLETPFGRAITNALGHLDAKDSLPWRAAYRHPEDASPGRYAAVARVRYRDSNGYPLDSLFALPYSVGKSAKKTTVAAVALEGPTHARPDDSDDPGRVPTPRLVAAPLDGTMAIRLTVVPVAGRSMPARLRLVLPESLALVPPVPDIVTLPETTEVVSFTVTNRTALAGSRLPIIAVIDATDGGVHHAAVAELKLDIAGRRPAPRTPHPPVPPWLVLAALAVWLVAEAMLRRRPIPRVPGLWLDVAVLGAATLLLASQFPWTHLLSDTLAIGGDTPAHHYLASHLRAQLFGHGRVVSWAPGWWCGFPMFQYYFPLPYLVMAALSLLFPANVAFKLGTVLGVFALPFGAYAGGRILRLRRPIPALLALATLPLLLDTTQRIWGVNLYSTLAGMISNSYSFALLPAALASAARDAFDARPRPRTVILLALVVLSHFFTAILIALLLGALFVGLALRAVQTRHGHDLRRALTLVPLGLMTFLVMAWWLVPLVATRPWSVDFGGAWSIDILDNLPVAVRWTLVPGLVTCVVLLAWRRLPLPEGWRVLAGLHLLMLIASYLLFEGGALVSAVFVNCRLWPFMLHAVLALAALAAGALACRARAPVLATTVCALAVFAYPWDEPNLAPLWAEYNYKGMEALPDAPVLEALCARLKGTPGRLAHDLHPGNEQLGSSRIFETMPHLCGKSILEGGIVNSALGSLAAYSVQGEISDNPAGWPLLVKPRAFDPATGLRRIELMGAKHFVARSRKVQQALRDDPAWDLVEDYGKWQLFENPSVDGALVRVWKTELPVVPVTDPQRDIVAWLGDPSAIAVPRILLRPGEPTPPKQTAVALPSSAGPPPPGFLDIVSTSVPLIAQSADRLRFRTDAIGKPHLIAVSYFPNWRVRGARHVYLATQGFMVVFPEERDVELRFGSTPANRVGQISTALGLVFLVAWRFDTRRPEAGER